MTSDEAFRVFNSEVEHARQTGLCMACDEATQSKGRKRVVCDNPDCVAYYHLLYDAARRLLGRNLKS